MCQIDTIVINSFEMTRGARCNEGLEIHLHAMHPKFDDKRKNRTGNLTLAGQMLCHRATWVHLLNKNHVIEHPVLRKSLFRWNTAVNLILVTGLA